MGLGRGRSQSPVGAVPLCSCRAQTPETLHTGGNRSELAHSTCRAWDHNVPNGNVFHFASQRALLSVGTVTRLSLLLSAAWMPFKLP